MIAMDNGPAPPKHPAEPSGDDASLDEIDVEECWKLLATQPVGRVAIIVGHYPLVFPVNFSLDGHDIMYRTGVGAKLHSIRRSNVTFEVDEIDPFHRSGWSVMVKGVAQEVDLERNPKTASRAEFGGAAPWAPGPREHLIRIVADQISGRRIQLAEGSPPGDPRGYR
jgi:uncharacterized protein